MAPRVVALISKKGGVGKTTSAVSLSAALAERGRRVLLIDLDPQANASLSLGVERGRLAPSMADVLMRNLPLAEAVRPTGMENLDLVTGSVDLEDLEHGGGYQNQSEASLRRKLEAADLPHDIVLVDCPGSFTLLTRNAVCACDGYIVPAVPHYLAVEGIRGLVQSVERLRQRGPDRHKGRLLGILPTMVDVRTRLTRETLEEVRGEFGAKVFAVEIRTNVRLAEAPGRGSTILQHDPEATGSRAYRLAAEELLLRLDEDDRRSASVTLHPAHPGHRPQAEPGHGTRQGTEAGAEEDAATSPGIVALALRH